MTWVTVYRDAAGHGHEVNDVIHIRFSGDEGITWTDEDTFTNGNAVNGFPISGHDANQSVIEAMVMKAPNDDLLCGVSETNVTAVARNGTYLYRSTDGGATWSDEGKINADNELIGGSGDWVVVGSTIYWAMFVDPGADLISPSKTALYKSTDNGATWVFVSDITSTAEATNEVGLTYISSTLIAVLRSDSETVTYLRKSVDDGATWGTLLSLGTRVIQRPKLHIYADEPGRIYLIGRDRITETEQRTVVYWSDDEGTSWNGPFFPDGLNDIVDDTGYSDMLKRANGQFYMLSYTGTTAAANIREYVFQPA